MTTKRPTHRVTHAQARELYRTFNEALSPLGYFVGWYGSTVTQAEGADVDLLVIPSGRAPGDVLTALNRLGGVTDAGYYAPAGFRNYLVVVGAVSVDLHVFVPAAEEEEA